ncbi:MAG: hypothetical protein WDZ94_03315 [Patescibacteria group bacterium]
MTNPTYIDTAGQITAIFASRVAKTARSSLATTLLKEKSCEQVAFLDMKSAPPRLEMMGDELCINGTIASAFLISDLLGTNQSDLEIPLLTKTINFTVDRSRVTVQFPLSSLVKDVLENRVILAGISYQIIPGIPKRQKLTNLQKQILNNLAKTNPAAGLIFYENNVIKPVIYVKKTNSVIWEQACGSGSLAFSLSTGITQVTQPSKEVITIKATNDTLSISTTALKTTRKVNA